MLHYRVNHNHVYSFESDEMTELLLVTKGRGPSLLAFLARVPFLHAAPGQYFGSSQITSRKSCWPVVMLSAHILNCWPLIWSTCDLSALRPQPCEWLSFTSLIAHSMWRFFLSSTVPLCQDVCLEINFSQPPLAYRFCDICIVAVGLQRSEGYVNDLHSYSFSFTLLPSLICCLCAFVDTHTHARAHTYITEQDQAVCTAATACHQGSKVHTIPLRATVLLQILIVSLSLSRSLPLLLPFSLSPFSSLSLSLPVPLLRSHCLRY